MIEERRKKSAIECAQMVAGPVTIDDISAVMEHLKALGGLIISQTLCIKATGTLQVNITKVFSHQTSLLCSRYLTELA